MLLAALAAAAVLFVKFRLESLRQVVQQAIAARMGADLVAERVQVNGFRGISIRDFATSFKTPNGPQVSVQAPEALIFIDIGDLFYGGLTIDRLQIDHAQITVERPQEDQWLAPRLADIADATGLEQLVAFRLRGEDCAVTLRNVVGESAVTLHHVGFDIAKLADAAEVSGKIYGALDAAGDKELAASFHYLSLEDFDLRLQTRALNAEDVNVFLPASQRLVSAGVLDASVRASGYPKGSSIVSLEAEFRDLVIRNQPALLEPATGTLSALATFNAETRAFTLTTAQIESQQLRGRVEGSIFFAEAPPRFQLSAESSQIPLEAVVQYLLASQPEALRPLVITVQDPYQVKLLLTGNTEAPLLSLEARVDSGTLSYVPLDAALPEVQLDLSLLNIGWDSTSLQPRGSFNIAKGKIRHVATALQASKVTGTCTLHEGQITLDPFTAELFGAPVSGSLEYAPEKRDLSFALAGMINVTKETPFIPDVSKLELTGPLNLRCSGSLTPERYALDLAVDGTQADVAYDWFLHKPPGIGLTLNAFNVDVRPQKSVQISGTASVDTADITTIFQFERKKNLWQLQEIRMKSATVEVGTLNKCMRVPYLGAGGTARDTSFEWKRVPEPGDKSHDITIQGIFDTLSLLPAEGDVPFQFEDTQLKVLFSDRNDGDTGVLNLNAAGAKAPPFGKKWFVPLRPQDPELAKRFPESERAWTFALQAGTLDLPPWKGAAFQGDAYTSPKENGLRSFSATIDSGTIDGAYTFNTSENISELKAKWDKIPASYLIQHLKFPAALNGTVTGGVQYTVDQDDPGTLKGTGAFDISEGQFSADFIYSLLEKRFDASIGSLPPSLRFSRMRADVELTGDTVHTNNILFESPGITISGKGQFVLQGDMNYVLNVAISPQVAEQVPALRDNFNIEGHRLTQSPIELAFHVSGPAFNPQGAVAGLPPVGVTLVSGAVEMTSEAIRVIDIPRQILIDLFKIGGGIVGAAQ